ncbi:YbaB/EbfC family nucleoid-associated protein [Streptomyces griseoaurantiacus]|uniref:YbaB/EbfC family nucleoid-associated protein n=1 Tax=Streptomyces griseoaurantiacus TaxID=68213 RepID=A0A7W2HVV5_9ACTN|nr:MULTISPECIES: YbaB/EbfC family nucleoid-associated protein [Streptomyces]MBA5223554.1 YbaB/EbfC family nucleoid-associated protein [Streptomyces griseoaurantiacus]WTI30197.1 YbaB/EbfC family nucleoid-associated protein [Streptomyces jietaisiensis]
MDSESIEKRLAKAMAQLEATEAAVAEAEGQLAHAEATVRSSDRAVEVTVTAQGDLTSVTFLDGKYRNMPAGQLASSVLEAVQEARARMARKVMATFEPFTKPNPEAPEISGFDVDWNKIFGPGVLEGPRSDRRRGAGRLRDEISEDPED